MTAKLYSGRLDYVINARKTDTQDTLLQRRRVMEDVMSFMSGEVVGGGRWQTSIVSCQCHDMTISKLAEYRQYTIIISIEH